MNAQSALIAGWTSLGAAAVVSYPVLKLLVALKSRQTISQYAPEGHLAKQGTPTMGGLIIVIGMLTALVVCGIQGYVQSRILISAWVAVLGFGAIGFIDDFVVPRVWTNKRGLGWKQKIVMQFLVGTPCAVLLLGSASSALSIGIATILILFFSNAYNFSDGLDGLAGSLGLLLCTGLATTASLLGIADVPVLALGLAGGFIPFLVLNAPPARVFMGDVGSLPIGGVIGLLVCAIVFSEGVFNTLTVPLALVVMSFVMVVELVPVPLQIFWVKIFKKRLFSFTPIHHAFEKKGWPESRVLWSFCLAQFVLTAIAISLLVFTLPGGPSGLE